MMSDVVICRKSGNKGWQCFTQFPDYHLCARLEFRMAVACLFSQSDLNSEDNLPVRGKNSRYLTTQNKMMSCLFVLTISERTNLNSEDTTSRANSNFVRNTFRFIIKFGL